MDEPEGPELSPAPEPATADHPPGPVERRVAALLTLLGDDTKTVSDVARDELKRAGEEALPALLRAVRSEHAPTRARARALVQEI
jgi:hypothetical protein